MAPVTRFGSALSSPRTAAAVLRALALRLGAELRAVGDVDLVAAVVAADAWMLALGAASLTDVTVRDGDAAEAMSNVLLRAAGLRPPAPATVDALARGAAPAPLPEHEAAAERYRAWALAMLGADAPDALQRAAADLDVPGPLSGFAALLALVADPLAPAN